MAVDQAAARTAGNDAKAYESLRLILQGSGADLRAAVGGRRPTSSRTAPTAASSTSGTPYADGHQQIVELDDAGPLVPAPSRSRSPTRRRRADRQLRPASTRRPRRSLDENGDDHDRRAPRRPDAGADRQPADAGARLRRRGRGRPRYQRPTEGVRMSAPERCSRSVAVAALRPWRRAATTTPRCPSRPPSVGDTGRARRTAHTDDPTTLASYEPGRRDRRAWQHRRPDPQERGRSGRRRLGRHLPDGGAQPADQPDRGLRHRGRRRRSARPSSVRTSTSTPTSSCAVITAAERIPLLDARRRASSTSWSATSRSTPAAGSRSPSRPCTTTRRRRCWCAAEDAELLHRRRDPGGPAGLRADRVDQPREHREAAAGRRSIVPADNHTGCLIKFQRGEVDAITGDDTVLAGLAAQDPYAVVPEQDPVQPTSRTASASTRTTSTSSRSSTTRSSRWRPRRLAARLQPLAEARARRGRAAQPHRPGR